MQDTVGKQESRACWRAQVDAEPETGAQPVRSSILDTSGPGTEGRPRRAGDLGHLLPISGNSRNVQVRPAQHLAAENHITFEQTVVLPVRRCHENCGEHARHVREEKGPRG